MLPRHFLSATTPLSGSDAVAAILLLDDGRYVLQLRDDIPTIFYPGHWGCFGGAVDPGEEPLAAICRELWEELAFEPESPREFTRFDFDLGRLGGRRVYRIYYEVAITTAALDQVVLGEGVAVRAFTAEEILARPHVTPYDAFALWLHHARGRLG